MSWEITIYSEKMVSLKVLFNFSSLSFDKQV